MRINLNENPRACFSEKYIPENNLLSTICEVHPIPDNFNQVKKMHKSLEEKKKKKKQTNIPKNTLFRDSSLIQSMVNVQEC